MMATQFQVVGEPAEAENESITEQGFGVFSISHAQRVFEKWTGSSEEELISHHDPVEYEGDKPVIYPEAMWENVFYEVAVYGKLALALKEEDGAVSFYYLPE